MRPCLKKTNQQMKSNKNKNKTISVHQDSEVLAPPQCQPVGLRHPWKTLSFWAWHKSWVIGMCLKDEDGPVNHPVTAPYCRMDPFEEKLQRLREAFNTGKTKQAKFRAEQLRSLGRFLQDNKKQLHDALAGDLGKVLLGHWVGTQRC